MTAILSYFKSMISIASAYSIPVRGRELELNSVKKSNTSGSGKHSTDFRICGTTGFRFLSHAYLLFGHNTIAESLKMAELSR